MTVCLTGDVHHMSLQTRDQEYMNRTEVEAAIEYAEIAGEYDVAVTLFITGKAAREEPERVQRLAGMEHVEIGGHNYWAFGTPLHKLFRGLVGTWNGPRHFQAWEIRKTVSAFSDLGISIQAWRDHAYRHDSNTKELLSQSGVTHFSDAVEPEGGVRLEDGITVVPINTPPDHEHVYHAFRSSDFVAESDFEGPFGQKSVDVEVWVEWVLKQANEMVTCGNAATVLAHPSCMKLADDFEAFKTLCAAIDSSYRAVTIPQV